jgi:uncharacterized RDD family membrane protein YckC
MSDGEGTPLHYYIRHRGRITGPIPLAELQRMVKRGQITRMHDLSVDNQTWNRAGDHQDLFPKEPPRMPVVSRGRPAASEVFEVEGDGAFDAADSAEGNSPFPSLADAIANDLSGAVQSAGSDVWHYSIAGQQTGPVTKATIQQMVRANQLRADDLVWREGEANWCSVIDAGLMPPPTSRVRDGSGAVTHLVSTGYAGFWIRACAYFLDGLILAAGAFAAFFTYGLFMMPEDEMLAVVQIEALSLLINTVGMWLYFALMESSPAQATLGKMALSIFVTDNRGKRLTFGRATGRYFAKIISGIILGIGYFMAGWTERKRSLHDMIASTLVCRR